MRLLPARSAPLAGFLVLAASLSACGGDDDGSVDAARPDTGTVDAPGADVVTPDAPVVDCTGLTVPALELARIEENPGADTYSVSLSWAASPDAVMAEVGTSVTEGFAPAMDPVAAGTSTGVAQVDKTLPDLFVRLVGVRGACREEGDAVRLAKPDYSDPARWNEGWIKVVSHTHTIADIKANVGGPVYANRINWFNGCFEELGDDEACHELYLRSFAESGVQWLVDAATDQDIGAVIITDHDNVGIWFTEVFRRYNRADPDGASVVHGMEWTSALGHLTVVGNFLPEIDRDASSYDLELARRIHTSTPLPPDTCDDSDENHDVNDPDFDGPDAPCARADHRGHGDDPITMMEATDSIEALHARGALVFINHPTNDAFIEPPMRWGLGNLDRVDGVEANTPDPTATNRNAPEYWRDMGLRQGRRWVGIAGTDCHVNGPVYDGDTGCNAFHGLTDLTHLDAPYMWVRTLRSTSAAANNDPDLVVAALREGRVTVVQDTDPAVVVDLGIDANGDGLIDYWSGSTVPACEQPGRDLFTVQVRVRAVQTHNYNVNIWLRDDEQRILDRTELTEGTVWEGSFEFSRDSDIEPGNDLGFAMAWVREDQRFSPDNDAGFSNPIFFEAGTGTLDCSTRDRDGR